MNTLLGDVRYALRGFRKAPGFTVTAILTLALGIGGTTAIFSLMDSVMLRSLPVADPASLYRIGEGNDCCVEGGPQDRWGMYSFPLFERLKAAAPEFEQLAAFQAGGVEASVRRVDTERAPRSLRSEFVTGNYFSVFGIQPFGGRLLSESDDRLSAPPVAVLSYRAWQAHYGADAAVVGSTFTVEGQAFTIIGIAPPGFFGETLRSDPPDIWLPLQQEPLIHGEGSLLRQSISAWLRAIGRLKPGATVEGMSPRLTAVLRQWIEHDAGYPAAWMSEITKMLPKQSITVIPAGAGVGVMKEQYSRSLQILMSVCGLVLLIACANLANLLLARSMARRTQTSVRIAVGASRGRIVRQALTESVLLALGGGIAGLFVAVLAQRLLLAIAFGGSSTLMPISTTPSLPVLGFALVLSLLTGVLFGTVPAWAATRSDPVEALRGSSRSIADGTSLPRRLLLVLQATLSVVLVAGATMLGRSLDNIENQNFGFETKNRITVNLNTLPASYTPEKLDAVYRSLEDKLMQLPGMQSASLALYSPFVDNWGEAILVAGRTASVSENSNSSWDRVSPSYFQTVGQPIVRGRGFNQTDRGKTAPVAVINEAFGKRFFPGEDPIGKRFGMDMPEYANTFEIVGITSDAKYIDPDKPARPMFFAPLAQYVGSYKHEILQKVDLWSHFIRNAVLVTSTDPGRLEPVLRKAFAEVDPNLTISSVRTMKQQVALNFDQQRAVASLAGLFGFVALILAAVGLYGVTAYTVVQRAGEIGVRMALGADRNKIIGLVLNGAFRNVAAGLLLGIPLSIAAGRLMGSQLYGIRSWDPVSLAAAVLALALCALIAAILPATRASAIDPMQALRAE